MNKAFGSLVSTAIAGLMVSSPALASSHDKKAPTGAAKDAAMACQNNTCKGHATCKGFGNASCSGKNECKGHGTLKAKNEAECTKAAGVWTAKK